MRKLLALGDGGSKTGFARVTRGVLDYLHHTGRWDVELRAINWRPNHKIPYPYEVLPVTATAHDPFGFEVVQQHIRDTKPDVIWMVQDLWNLSVYATRKPLEIPSVGYFPIDCPNMKPSWAIGLGAFSEAVAYTVFGATESAAAVRRAVDMMAIDAASGKLGTQTRATWVTAPLGRAKLPCRLDRLARWQNLNNWNVVPHGVDLSSFRPLDKTSARKVFALPQSAFVVGSVNTNQFRKRQDITMRAFAVLRRRVPDAILVLHCSGGDSQGWDLAQLADYLGITDSVFLVHHSHPQLSEEQLAALYNTFDVHLNTSGGEGWGLTSVESAACGVPQMVPNWSATREIWQRWGVLLPVENWRYEPKGLNTAHCQVSVEQTAELLVEIAQNHAYRERLGLLAQQRAGQQFGWDRVGMAFEEIMQRALKEPRAVGLSVEEMIRDRVGRVDSELAGVLTQSDYRARYGAEVTQPQK